MWQMTGRAMRKNPDAQAHARRLNDNQTDDRVIAVRHLQCRASIS